jgi:DNA topoisomerase-3
LTGFRSRMGKPFSAGIRLNNELKIEFDFGQSRLEEELANPPDFTNQESLGACPKCGSRVFEFGTVYVCEKAVGAERSCEFRSGKMILQQPVERAQMQKLLATGRTDLLTAFVSNKNGRRFKAFLVKTPEGKVAFEFEAREPRAPKAGEPASYAAGKRGRGAPAAQPQPAAAAPAAKDTRTKSPKAKAAAKPARPAAPKAAPKAAAKSKRKAA